jgi:hypothetical protein
MRFCVPGPGALFAGLIGFLLIFDVCLADNSPESLTKSTIAVLESSLKAHIPASLAQATEDYSAARSIFERCLFFVSQCEGFGRCFLRHVH